MNRRNLIACAALLAAGAAHAGTVYRDQFIPNTPPCFVDFAGRTINAILIAEVWVGEWTTYERKPGDWTNSQVTTRALVVKMADRHYHYVRTGDLERQKAELLAAVAAKCSR